MQQKYVRMVGMYTVLERRKNQPFLILGSVDKPLKTAVINLATQI